MNCLQAFIFQNKNQRNYGAPDVWLELPYALGSFSCWFSNAELIHFNIKELGIFCDLYS